MTGGLIYVGGYGRSGSTVLERLLTRHSTVIGCGEVVRLSWANYDPGMKCTCGALPKDCAIWGRFLDTGLSHPQLTIALMESISDQYRIMVEFVEDGLVFDVCAIPFECNSEGQVPARPSRPRPARRCVVEGCGSTTTNRNPQSSETLDVASTRFWGGGAQIWCASCSPSSILANTCGYATRIWCELMRRS